MCESFLQSKWQSTKMVLFVVVGGGGGGGGGGERERNK